MGASFSRRKSAETFRPAENLRFCMNDPFLRFAERCQKKTSEKRKYLNFYEQLAINELCLLQGENDGK